MRLKLDQIEKLAYFLNHLHNQTNNFRCDRYGGMMEICAWSGNPDKLKKVVEKTGIKPINENWAAGCLFMTWRI